MQKLILGYYLNKCALNPSQFTERFEFCKILTSSMDNASEKLDLLLKQAGLSLSFDQLIEESLLFINNLEESEKAGLSPLANIPKIKKLKLAPKFYSESLPQTYMEFSQIYLYKKCDTCQQKHNLKSVCLICGTCYCEVTCFPNIPRQEAGNLNIHAAQCHMGLGLFYMMDNHLILETKGLVNLIYVPGPTYMSELGESIFNVFMKEDSSTGSVVPKSTDFKKFVLNKRIFDKLEKIVMNHSVGQEIFENAPLSITAGMYFVDPRV